MTRIHRGFYYDLPVSARAAEEPMAGPLRGQTALSSKLKTHDSKLACCPLTTGHSINPSCAFHA